MKSFILLVFGVPAMILMLGSTGSSSGSSVSYDSPPVQKPVEHPVVIQIEHQGFPFDVNGNFPYVVMIDNQVYRYNKSDVSDFLSKAVDAKEGSVPRTRVLN
jgi:hypothetical protein